MPKAKGRLHHRKEKDKEKEKTKRREKKVEIMTPIPEPIPKLAKLIRSNFNTKKIIKRSRVAPETILETEPLPVEDIEDEIVSNRRLTQAFENTKPGNPTHLEICQIELPLIIKFIYHIGGFLEWIVYAMVVISFWLVTYVSVFSFYQEIVFSTVLVFDIFFALDTLARVVVEHWRYHREIPCIIYMTPYSFFQFLMDMISMLPLERIFVLCVGTNNLHYLTIYDFFRYNRFFRFFRVYRFLRIAVQEGRISDRISFMLKYFTFYIGFIQIVSCVFYFILPLNSVDYLLLTKKDVLSGTWLGNLREIKPDYSDNDIDHYILSSVFSAAVVTTTGHGDLSPKNQKEMLIAIFVMLVGAILLSGFFTSGLTSFELEQDGARFDLFFRVKAIMAHLHYIRASQLFRSKVSEYYRLLWNYREGVYDVQFLSQLPTSMQEDMLYDICQEMFHLAPLFRNLDEPFLRAVARIVKVVLYNPDMILCAGGSYAINMFYIIQGEVRVKSKFDPNFTSCILRAGCIIGELNLFFSFPYTTTMETKTCCQLLKIEKEDLVQLFEKYPTVLSAFRERVEQRLVNLPQCYDLIGEEPIAWISAKDDLGLGGTRSKNDRPVSMRRGTGLNKVVDEDVVDDTERLIIIGMPCIDRQFEKEHITVFQSCVIPPILTSEEKWVQVWVVFMLVLTCYGAFIGPYCHVFQGTSDTEQVFCVFDEKFYWGLILINLTDLIIEITQCVPVVGFYYKATDGLRVKIVELTFWLDVMSTFPWAAVPFIDSSLHIEFDILKNVFRGLKLWKVIRYFTFMDNKHPNRLFFFRLFQTALVLLYGVHFLACFLYGIACPVGDDDERQVPKCRPDSWLRSYEVNDPRSTDPTISYSFLGEEFPYVISFYFASATLTSAGFGDFSPQTKGEMLSMIFFELLSFFIIGYYTALLTSALSCTVRPKLVFQQKLFAIRQFMDHHGLDENLQHRVVEHYYLQDQLWSSVNLPPDTSHMMYDTPDYLHEDALYLEVELHFDGVPIFTKLDPKSIVKITKLVRRYLIPPGSIFLRKGEVRRQMYVIGRGSVAILDNSEKPKPLKVLEATAHFGIRDLMFGEPAHHHIKTLSYCLLYEIELRDLIQVFEKDSELKDLIDSEKTKLQKDIDMLTNEYSKNKAKINEKVSPIRSWLIFPKESELVNSHCTLEEFDEVFEKLKFSKLYYLLLLRRTIHPAGDFAKVWSAWMSLISAMTILCLLMESFIGVRAKWIRHLQIALDLVNFLDIYLHLHWGYYNEANILISHPVKTSINYVFDGNFIYDVVFTAPFEHIIDIMLGNNPFSPSFSNAAYWYSKMRWTRVGQILRIPSIFNICHNIFAMRSLVLLALYVSATLILSTAIGGISAYIACPSGPRIWQPGDENRLPFCAKNSWTSTKLSVNLDQFYERWVLSVYYVSQVILVIGFGDMITLQSSEVYLMIIMMIFGFVIIRCVIADITAAEVDIDEVRAKYLEQKKCISLIMARESVHYRLVASVEEHLTYNWTKSKGLQPKQLFADLHPALEADLFRDFVGEQLKKVPVFANLTENVVRTLCQFMKKLHFLKGERLMRYGNLEFEMYIIVEGKVWMMDKSSNWFCTLKSGQSFGEASMLYGLQREFTAVAGSSVEVFVLTAQDYTEVLERYPVVQQEISKKLRHGTQDIFEKRIRNARRKASLEHREDNETKAFNRTSFINHLLDSKDHPNLEDVDRGDANNYLKSTLKASRGFVASGSDDDHLAFLYFASSNKKFKFLIHPKCGMMKTFSELIVWISFITCCLAAYEICFNNDSPHTPLDEAKIGNIIPRISLVIEFPMYLHIFLNFFTPFLLYEGQYCKEYKPIAYNYMTSITRFPLDLIGSLPILLILSAANVNVENYNYLYALRAARLVHFYRSLLQKKYDLAVSTFRYKITLSLLSFLLMAHVLACVFYTLSPCQCPKVCDFYLNFTQEDIERIVRDDMCKPKTWTIFFVQQNDVNTLEHMAPWRWYIRSLYWVVTTVSTTGFGDITAQNASETLVAIVCIFCAGFALSIILSHFTSGIASLNHAHREYFYRVNLLAKYLSNLGMSREKRDLVMAYFLVLWDGFRGVTYQNATNILPLTMKIEVCYALMYSVVRNCKIFQGVEDKSFLRQVCASMNHTIYLPGTNIVNEGDQGDKMFIVFKGRISGAIKWEGRPLLKRQYLAGQAFGRLPCLFYDQSYTKTYRTETQSEVLSLDQANILQLVKFYPEFKKIVGSLIARKYEPRDESKNIFQDRIVKTDAFEFKVGAHIKDNDSDEPKKFDKIHDFIKAKIKRASTPVGQTISRPVRLFKIIPTDQTAKDKILKKVKKNPNTLAHPAPHGRVRRHSHPQSDKPRHRRHSRPQQENLEAQKTQLPKQKKPNRDIPATHEPQSENQEENLHPRRRSHSRKRRNSGRRRSRNQK